jgi:hypothetical protein
MKLNRMFMSLEERLDDATVTKGLTYSFTSRSYEMFFMLHATIIGENYEDKEVDTNMFKMQVYALEVRNKATGEKIEFITGLDRKTCAIARDYIIEYRLSMEDIEPALENRKVVTKGKFGLELQDAPIPDPASFDNRSKAEVRKFVQRCRRDLYPYVNVKDAIKSIKRTQLEVHALADSKVGEDLTA